MSSPTQMDTPSRSGSSRKPFNWIVWSIGLGFILVIADLLFWPVDGGKESARSASCLSNIKRLAVNNQLYASDHDGRFPHRDTWMDATAPYVNNPMAYRCPEFLRKEMNTDVYGYAFNGALSCAIEPEQPETVPLVFDSMHLARNASGTPESVPKPGRHSIGDSHRNSMGYADGHAKRIP